MKKTFKRAGVAVLSMAMLLSMGAVGAMTASAASANYTVNETATLTASNSTFKAYKVSDNLGNLEGTWTLPEGNTMSNYFNMSSTSSNVKVLAGKLATQLNGKTAVNPTGTALGSPLTLEDGYYLVIVRTTANNDLIEPMLVQVKDGAVTDSTPKTQKLTLTKGITKVGGGEDSVGNKATNNPGVLDSTGEVKVGDVVEYEIITSMPKYNPSLDTITTRAFIADEPTNLNDDNSTVKVYYKGGDIAATDYTEMAADSYDLDEYGDAVTGAPANDKDGFKITFKSDAMKRFRGCDLKVTYSATVLASVDVTDSGNPNTAKLVYCRDYVTGDANTPTNPDEQPDPTTNPPVGTEEVDDTATVYSTQLNIVKTAGSKAKDGFKFTLMNGTEYVQANGSLGTDEYKFETDADGKITINGLDAGTYTLTETDGKATNRKLDGPVTVTIGATKNANDMYDGTYTYSEQTTSNSDTTYVSMNGNTITVDNPEFNSLPGTGGMGTVLFTVGGAAIVLLAGALFVVYMRKRKVEE